MTGKVYLVGAGPGDAKLITVKGLECIQKADVLVYDRLASPRLLKKMKPGGDKVYVGKLPDRHTMKQEEINQLLVDLALQGKTVVRLKGGDPTIFGRVGEEAGLLRQHGIPYEIIPGITSAISVPAYAGIPVTHRDHASSLSIITGHESPDKLDHSIHWDKVTNATGTLVFLMGVAKIGYISNQLIKHGRPPETPVALVRWGTRAEQETLVGTLADIEAKVRAADFQPPAVIVVGDVVLQREELMWAEALPLFGKRILVTRSRSQASELVDRIEELGGEPYEFPVIETIMPEGEAKKAIIAEALGALAAYDWVFFTSVNGVEFFFRHLEELGADIRRLYRARIAAVGPATARALAQRGLVSEALPERFQAEGLVEKFGAELQPGQKVLLPRGDLARDWLPDKLKEMGLQVTEADTYETVVTGEDDDELLKLLEEGRVHVVTFTSSSTVRNFLTILKRMGVHDPLPLLANVKVACIGPLTQKTAMEAGLTPGLLAEESTLEALVQELCRWNAETRNNA
ncbi:uroporphyrinogen-III C-methyltransferase [Bacillus sp. FJAT-27264]|uniref:uroporphyrinogen-III C-methyltransferase n=1 Tax=Paenibacillus sp. (strain DSM 101736 / FJAT-27264) TaxID=1850362 RepID=UPI000807FFFD|nr:uroporphyrinogen-III C-methyltransferase [Bacillus sp. FJAT-27264]OBZ09835.1 uroporphyrinogen-III C-methyltransferase [Bacillus sp. FJAT-27264]